MTINTRSFGLLSLVLTVTSLLVISSEGLASGPQLNVCTVTINSADEKESFQKNLSGQNFNFIELTDYGTPQDENKEGWFDKACKAKVKCDVLVISGHFGGEFFGDKGFTLTPTTLERYSCQRACPGILEQPKEVFLFGCNTLATKNKDHRSPEEYVRVLTNDGISLPNAIRIAQSRYGVLGDSYRSQMQRIFSKVPHIYGFDSVGPLGKNVRPFLEKYFQKVPNYHEHISRIDKDSAELTRAEAFKNGTNVTLQTILDHTAFAQCAGLKPSDPAYPIKQNICKLHDSNMSFSQKMRVIEEMLLSAENTLYLPSVTNFLKRNQRQLAQDIEAQRVLVSVRSQVRIEKLLVELLDKSKEATIKVDILFLQHMLGWLNKSQFDTNVKAIAKPYLNNLTRDNIETLCAVSSEGLVNIKVTLEDFNLQQLQLPEVVAALRCVETQDQRITQIALPVLQNAPILYMSRLISTAKRLPGFDREITNAIRPLTQSKVHGISELARDLILYRGQDAEKPEHVRELVKKDKNMWLLNEYVNRASGPSDQAALAFADALVTEKRPDARFIFAKAVARLIGEKSNSWSSAFAKLANADAEVQTQLAIQIALRNPDNVLVGAWAFERMIGFKAATGYQYYVDILAHVTFDKDLTSQIMAFIKQNPSNPKIGYLRWALQMQKAKAYSPAEAQLAAGPLFKYECSSQGEDSFSCSDK